MLLCDVGNTHLHFFEKDQTYKVAVQDFDFSSITQDVFYINVNPGFAQKVAFQALWHDLEPMIELEGSYETLGVDRKLAAWYLHDGIVVDAGSAITVDVMKQGIYQGGFIFPGFRAMQKAFKDISSRLDYLLNFELALDKMTKNSQDAISYGAFAPIIHEIKQLAVDKKVISTGGDGAFIASHVKEASYHPHLLFHAMNHLLATKKGYRC